MRKLPGVRRSVLTILLILFFMAILPIYLLGYGIYQWGYQMTTDEITQSLQTRASFFIATLDAELQRIRKVHQECLNDSDLYYYVNAAPIMSNYERVSRLLSIEKRLGLVSDSSAYIEEVTLWMPRQQQMISASGGITPADDQWRTLMAAPSMSREFGFSVYDGSLYLCAAYPTDGRRPDRVPQYILVIRLSNERIMDELMSFNLHPDSGTLLCSEDWSFRLKTGLELQVPDDAFSKELSITTANGKFLLVSADSATLDLQLHTYVSERIIYGGLNSYRNLFLLFTVVAFMMILAFFAFSRRFVSEPVRKLVGSLKQVEKGRLDVRIDYRLNDEFGYIYKAFNQMAEALTNMIEINTRQLKLTQEAELRQLQAQINPHFLHNCFYLLYRMAKDEDYENISEFLTYLSEYYRYVTRNASMEVPLSAEDSHTRRYVQIQLVRFGRRISAELPPLPEALKGIMVPRLILQPLLENVFQHGLKDTISGGQLRVWYEIRSTGFCVHVEDNGAGITGSRLAELQSKLQSAADANMERSGIINIHQRLRITFGPDSGLTAENLPTGGARFTLTFIPDNFHPEQDPEQDQDPN